MSAIKGHEFDVIIFTGDYVFSDGDFSDGALAPLVEILGQLPADVPKYYVLGNKEIPFGLAGTYSVVPSEPLKIMAAFEKFGARHIYPAIEIRRGEESIWLTDWSYHVFSGGNRPLEIMESTYLPLYDDATADDIKSFWEQAVTDGRTDSNTADYRRDFELRALDFLWTRNQRQQPLVSSIPAV